MRGSEANLADSRQEFCAGTDTDFAVLRPDDHLRSESSAVDFRHLAGPGSFDYSDLVTSKIVPDTTIDFTYDAGESEQTSPLDGGGEPRDLDRPADPQLEAERQPSDHPEGFRPSIPLDDPRETESSPENWERKHPGETDKTSERSLEKSKLVDLARRALSPERYDQFVANMERLESRRGKNGLTEKEIGETFTQVARLFEATGDTPLSAFQRHRLARQIMAQAATPTAIDQGSHLSCTVTTLEVRTYTRTPSQAARLVADVALTGKYMSTDGKTVVSLNPQPVGESSTADVASSSRTHASQIFQVASANLFYAADRRRTGKDIRYEQRQPEPGKPNDRGERLFDYSKTPAKLIDQSPGFTGGELGMISNMITGKTELDVVIGHEGYFVDTKRNGFRTYKSEKELQSKLENLKKEDRLPVLLVVNTSMDPFHADSGYGRAETPGGKHVVTVTDYDPGPPAKVAVDNQWGDFLDRNNRDRMISLDTLYLSTLNTVDAIPAMEKSVREDRSNGRFDITKEFNLLRLKKDAKWLRADDFPESIKEFINAAKKHWDWYGITREDCRRTVDDVGRLTMELSPKHQLDVLNLLRKHKFISADEHKQKIARIMGSKPRHFVSGS